VNDTSRNDLRWPADDLPRNADDLSGDADNLSNKSARSMGIISEMQSIVRTACEPATPGESVNSAILRASRRLKIGFRRAREFWYGEKINVRAHEADHMRAAELRLLAERHRRLLGEIALIRARLDAQSETEGGAAPGARAAVAERAGGGGGEAADAPRIGTAAD
jgi:hypothetical protein